MAYCRSRLHPGNTHVSVDFAGGDGIGVVSRPPKVDLGVEGTNVNTTLALPSDRWILFAWGRGVGPAILYWGELALFVVIALALGRLRRTPLRTRDWLLLGLGLSTFSWWVLIVFGAWLFVLDRRGGSALREALAVQHGAGRCLQRSPSRRSRCWSARFRTACSASRTWVCSTQAGTCRGSWIARPRSCRSRSSSRCRSGSTSSRCCCGRCGCRSRCCGGCRGRGGSMQSKGCGEGKSRAEARPTGDRMRSFSSEGALVKACTRCDPRMRPCVRLRTPMNESPRCRARRRRRSRRRTRSVRLRQARGNDPDARRREAQDLHPDPEGREERADAADAHAVRRRQPRARASTARTCSRPCRR